MHTQYVRTQRIVYPLSVGVSKTLTMIDRVNNDESSLTYQIYIRVVSLIITRNRFTVYNDVVFTICSVIPIPIRTYAMANTLVDVEVLENILKKSKNMETTIQTQNMIIKDLVEKMENTILTCSNLQHEVTHQKMLIATLNFDMYGEQVVVEN